MTVSIGGIVLNDDLYLEGLENAKRVAVTKYVHLAGTTTVNTMVMGDNFPLTLTTVSDGDSLQGHFCQAQVDQIKSIEAGGVPITLTYRDRGDFNVLITGTNFKQFDQRVPTSVVDKWYTGAIYMEMV